MKYKINKGFIVQKLDDKTVIFDGEESVLYTFNESASYIFRELKKETDESIIVQKMTKNYSIKEEKAKQDMKELISDLRKKKIISVFQPKK